MEKGSQVKRFRNSIKYALRGLDYVIKNERNFQIELLSGAVVLTLALILNVRSWEIILIILLVMWVLVMELINTVLERVVDILKPRVHPYSRLIKDIMASVVLVSSIFSALAGAIIFWPYLKSILIY